MYLGIYGFFENFYSQLNVYNLFIVTIYWGFLKKIQYIVFGGLTGTKNAFLSAMSFVRRP